MSYSLAFTQAIFCTLFVSDKVRQGFFDFVPTGKMAEALNLTAPTAVKILQSLNRAGIIETREGANGGVRLAVPPAQVTLLDILNAIEGGRPLFHAAVRLRVTGEKPTRAQAGIARILADAENAMKSALKNIIIDDLIRELNR